MFDKLTKNECSILEDSLSDYAILLRTIQSPNGEDKILSEQEFKNSVSMSRLGRYFVTMGMLAEIRARLQKFD